MPPFRCAAPTAALLAVAATFALAGTARADPPRAGDRVLRTEVSRPAAPPARSWLGPQEVGAVKASVAVAATALLALGLVLDRPGRRGPAARSRDVALAGLALVGLACWWNLFRFHFPGFAHPSDSFHYYLGAKYFPELGYTGLYECVAVADAQAGLDAHALRRPLRDLVSNELTTTDAILADPDRCTSRFSAQNWAEFRHDVDFLRGLVPLRRWKLFQQDHGYNATPAWGLLGHALTRAAPASRSQLRLLWALDPALLAVLWGGALWAFGWRPAAVAAIYWGTNTLSPYGWTGGSILRLDWLAASVLGIALLRRERPAAGGALLAWATLLRIFPGCLAAGVVLGALWRMLRERRFALRPAERRFAAGALLCLGVGVVVSSAALGGIGTWREFAQRSRVQLSTPLANHVGLITLLSYDPEMRSARSRDASLPDPMQRWKQARRERFAERRPGFAALVAGFCLLLAGAAAGQPLWVGAALGATLVPVALELTGYYWSVLLVTGLLAARIPAIAPLLCGFAAAGWGVSLLWHWTDEIHVALSLLGVVFAVACTLLAASRVGRVTPE